MSFSNTEFWDRGFVKCTDNIDRESVTTVHNYMKSSGEIDRGHDAHGKYHPKPPNYPVKWANYWSQDLNHIPSVDRIAKFYLPQVALLLDDPVIYHSDFVVTTPDHRGVRPHIDTPYRFESFSDETDLLGVQCLMPLTDFNQVTGGTAFVPGSHNENWDIKKCYQGEYNDYFLDNYQQPQLTPGEMLFWHPRTLHSAMPNNSSWTRVALLILYIERRINDEVRVIDNIFS